MKASIQKAGRFLSSMVMPNIGAFIAWGLITAFFIPDGWTPNESLNALVSPMLTYLIPLLIAYTGGFVVAGKRGGVVGAVAAIGTIVGYDQPMILGAMIAGPLGGVAIKYFDKATKGKVKSGFEMLVDNFSAGIIGAILCVVGLKGINPVCVHLTSWLASGVQFLVDHSIMPLTAVVVEPAKVLFLNNAINHGVFTPLGIEQAAAVGKSMFFMIESNPGPGFGLLLAYMLFGRGTARSTAPAAAIIQFFGGIHEIYFPYVLMNPIVILGPIAGNVCSIFILHTFNGGLVAAASPGSIFAEMMMTPKGGFLPNILAIGTAIVVSFLVSSFLLKVFGKDGDLDAAQQQVSGMKAQSKGVTSAAVAAVTSAAAVVDSVTAVAGPVSKIAFACDAGMGSSAMGATMLRKKLKAAGLDGIEVIHCPVSEIPPDAQVIVTHRELAQRAGLASPNAEVIAITNFMGAPEYDTLVADLTQRQGSLA
ncbi:MAG: PTS mannitol transporter subunit IICBA [Propionibacteriaceae bacterium]|jgi:PTS system mannitol-specific IIC component|nr:PTS mannitol transporter subunit IICBA [Propionibacteriaceae bacterium]